MDAHQEHTQSHAWEMGMFQVDGKNPPRDIILQLIRCKHFYDFIRTILGITWVEIRTGRLLPFVPLNNFDIAEAPITVVAPSGNLFVTVPPSLYSALIS